MAQLGYRFNNHLGAVVALGAHGSDPPHWESAWLEGRGQFGATEWTWGAGRQAPSLGPVMTRAGHLDRFGLMPLAKQVVMNGDWIEDGTELGLRRPWAGATWTLNLGVWRGSTFPGSSDGPVAPSLHTGVQFDGMAGEWSVDAFAAQAEPTGRGSRITSSNGTHSHTAPMCDPSLNQIVCFDGRSRLSGLSAEWAGSDWPLTLAGAVMWRTEEGSLESRNGWGRYTGRNRGDWVQGIWHWASAWDLGIRHERLSAKHTLVGPGASLVANEAGLARYAPQRRTTLMFGHRLTPWAEVRVEGGRETAGAQSARFMALRWVLQWDRSVARQ